MNPKLEVAKKVLENIINREQKFSSGVYEESIAYRQNNGDLKGQTREVIIEHMHLLERKYYYLRKNISELINKGTRQIVLNLTDYYVGKTIPANELSHHYELVQVPQGIHISIKLQN